MDMILHDDVGIQIKAFLGDQKAEGIEQNCGNIQVTKKRKPVYRRGSYKVWMRVTCEELIVGACHMVRDAEHQRGSSHAEHGNQTYEPDLPGRRCEKQVTRYGEGNQPKFF